MSSKAGKDHDVQEGSLNNDEMVEMGEAEDNQSQREDESLRQSVNQRMHNSSSSKAIEDAFQRQYRETDPENQHQDPQTSKENQINTENFEQMYQLVQESMQEEFQKQISEIETTNRIEILQLKAQISHLETQLLQGNNHDEIIAKYEKREQDLQDRFRIEMEDVVKRCEVEMEQILKTKGLSSQRRGELEAEVREKIQKKLENEKIIELKALEDKIEIKKQEEFEKQLSKEKRQIQTNLEMNYQRKLNQLEKEYKDKEEKFQKEVAKEKAELGRMRSLWNVRMKKLKELLKKQTEEELQNEMNTSKSQKKPIKSEKLNMRRIEKGFQKLLGREDEVQFDQNEDSDYEQREVQAGSNEMEEDEQTQPYQNSDPTKQTGRFGAKIPEPQTYEENPNLQQNLAVEEYEEDHQDHHDRQEHQEAKANIRLTNSRQTSEASESLRKAFKEPRLATEPRTDVILNTKPSSQYPFSFYPSPRDPPINQDILRIREEESKKDQELDIEIPLAPKTSNIYSHPTHGAGKEADTYRHDPRHTFGNLFEHMDQPQNQKVRMTSEAAPSNLIFKGIVPSGNLLRDPLIDYLKDTDDLTNQRMAYANNFSSVPRTTMDTATFYGSPHNPIFQTSPGFKTNSMKNFKPKLSGEPNRQDQESTKPEEPQHIYPHILQINKQIGKKGVIDESHVQPPLESIFDYTLTISTDQSMVSSYRNVIGTIRASYEYEVRLASILARAKSRGIEIDKITKLWTECCAGKNDIAPMVEELEKMTPQEARYRLKMEESYWIELMSKNKEAFKKLKKRETVRSQITSMAVEYARPCDLEEFIRSSNSCYIVLRGINNSLKEHMNKSLTYKGVKLEQLAKADAFEEEMLHKAQIAQIRERFK